MKRWGILTFLFVLTACAAGRPEPARLTATGEHYTVTVALDSPSTGDVEADVQVDRDARLVALSAAMPEMGHVMPEVPARQRNAGHFHAEGELFAMPGVWDLDVRVEGDAGTDTLTFPVIVER